MLRTPNAGTDSPFPGNSEGFAGVREVTGSGVTRRGGGEGGGGEVATKDSLILAHRDGSYLKKTEKSELERARVARSDIRQRSRFASLCQYTFPLLI